MWGYLFGCRADPPDVMSLVCHMTAFMVGSSLLHSAACTINDICDRDFDRQVGEFISLDASRSAVVLTT